MAHLIVLGNEKGGSGKSTAAMHVATALLRSGYRVGAIDLDLRQRSLATYIAHRRAFVARGGAALPEPETASLAPSEADSLRAAQAEEEGRFADAIARLDTTCRFIVIDCPGAHTRYAEMAHAAADTLITPLNDSLVDLSLLARLDPETERILGPSVYAEMVWAARTLRAAAGLVPVDWVVLRNRLSTLDARNKRRVAGTLGDLARRIGFRLVPGFSERVIFRELYLKGLTLLDLADAGTGRITMSHIAARQEIRELMAALRLPDTELAL